MRYRLGQPIAAVKRDGIGRKQITTLPAEAVVTVLTDPDNSGFVDVRWEGREYFMFLLDLKERAVRIEDAETDLAERLMTAPLPQPGPDINRQ